MKSLILEYKTPPKSINTSAILNEIEYSKELNLTVLKKDKKPAILEAQMETNTFTKADGEASDSDHDLFSDLKIHLETSTITLVEGESTDSDPFHNNLALLLETKTLTEATEDTDSDK